MRSWKTALVALVIVGLATATFVPLVRHVRSAGPVTAIAATARAELRFDRHESAGLFVGVSDFNDGSLAKVPFSVDDAVDLAYMFAMDRRLPLIPPQRVVLALSGAPKKKESKARLEELKAAGAKEVKATARDILYQVKQQAAITGSAGIFILSIATHGFMHEGNEYILGESSTFRDPRTSLQTARLFDIIARSPAHRSLIFVDACRDRTLGGTRSVVGSPAPDLDRKMKNISGQVVFYAASAGNYAYDDYVNRNGVFTKAVLDGLACNASASDRFVTVDSLHRHTEAQVKRWIVDHQKPPVDTAIQVHIDGGAGRMPLSQCWWPPGRERLSVTFEGTRLTLKNQENQRLWEPSFPSSPILHADVADVDADGVQEIIVAHKDRLVVFNREFTQLWPSDIPGLQTFATGDLERKHVDQVVALSDSAITIISRDGEITGRFTELSGLRHIAVFRQTSGHKPWIVATTGDSLFSLTSTGALRWRRLAPPGEEIRNLQIVSRDPELKRQDIAITTNRGTAYFDSNGDPTRMTPADEWKKPTRRRRSYRLP
jgi:caspase domain-containing protein